MRTIIAADLHGLSEPFRSLMAALDRQAIFVSPWAGDGCPFPSEAAAHAAFIAQDGGQRYAEKIAAAAGDEPAFIVAFSVGASAAWRYAASCHGHPQSAATLFYGSRIREHVLLKPRFAITAVFAQIESSFSPSQLAQLIAGDRVRTVIEPATRHGFMNPGSAHFAPSLCALHLRRLTTELARWRADL